MKRFLVFVFFFLTGCATDHAWIGERKFSYCAICFEYDEKADTTLKAQASQGK